MFFDVLVGFYLEFDIFIEIFIYLYFGVILGFVIRVNII